MTLETLKTMSLYVGGAGASLACGASLCGDWINAAANSLFGASAMGGAGPTLALVLQWVGVGLIAPALLGLYVHWILQLRSSART